MFGQIVLGFARVKGGLPYWLVELQLNNKDPAPLCVGPVLVDLARGFDGGPLSGEPRLSERGRVEVAVPETAPEAVAIVALVRLVVGDGIVDGFQFGLLDGREVGVAAVDERGAAVAVVTENLEDGDRAAAEFGGIEGGGFQRRFVGGNVLFVLED